MKKKLLVDLPDELIDETSKKMIKSLQSENAKLKKENAKYLSQINTNVNVVLRAQRLVEAVRDAGDFCYDHCYGDNG